MRFLLVPILLILAFNSLAQDDFLEGYILKNNGDSLRGYLKKDVDWKLAEGVKFKNSLTEKELSFLTVHEAKAFAFDNGNTYKAITYFDPLDSGRSKRVFAKYLVEGSHSLYSIPNNEAYNFYIESVADSGYYVFDDVMVGGMVDQKGNFRGILNFLARNCEKIQHRLVNVAFTESMMIDFINDLNTCMGDTKSVVHYKKNKKEISPLFYLGGMAYQKNSTYTFQGQLRFMYPGISRKASLVVGLSYSHVTNYDYSVIEGEYSNFITQIISLPVCFQYNFTESKFQPLIYAGLSAAYVDRDYPDLVYKKGFQQNYGIALLGGIGLEYYPIKHLAIKADWRYELIAHTPTIGVVYKIK